MNMHHAELRLTFDYSTPQKIVPQQMKMGYQYNASPNLRRRFSSLGAVAAVAASA